MRGRFHFYEGNAMSTVVMPVRAMRLIGVKLLIVTNAAGGLNPEFSVGDVMIIQDYFALPCMSGNNPLVGTNDDALGPRFPSVSDAFDEAIQDIVLKVGSDLGYSNSLRPNGTYCFVSGPQYESKAEARFLRSIGGDSVGMSTIPEVIAAKHCGMKILGLSLITNKVLVGKSDLPPASHAEVLAAVEQSGKRVEALVKAIASTKELKDYIDKQPNFIYKPSKKSSTAKDNHHTSKSGTASTRNSLFENSALLLTSVAAAVLVTIAVGKIRL